MQLFQQAAKAQILVTLKDKIFAAAKLKEDKQPTLGEFLSSGLSEEEKNLLLGFKIGQIFSEQQPVETKKEEKKTERTHVPVGSEADYKAKVLKFLKGGGLGESLCGFKTGEIVAECGGDTTVARKVLEQLHKDKEVDSNGNTQGKRWVAKEYAKKANENWLAKQGGK